MAKKSKIVKVASILDYYNRIARYDCSWELVGSGFYGSAYAKGDMVWKFDLTGTKRRQGYRRFAEAVAKGHLCGPHYPRIKLMLVDSTGRCAVLMERLSFTLSKMEYKDYDRFCEVTFSIGEHKTHTLSGRKTLYGPVLLPVLQRETQRLADIMSRKVPAPRGLGSLVGRGNDMHNGNFMFRKDGTVVITDPCV